MKHRLTAVVVTLVLVGMGIAAAIGGSAGDPLVTRSYLESTYLAALTETLQKRAAEDTKELYAQVAERLEGIGEADVQAAQSGIGVGAGYTSLPLEAESTLTLTSGSCLVVYRGVSRLTEGTLADVTTGESVAPGGLLEAAHRYVVTSPEDALVTQEETGAVGYQGKASAELPAIELPFTDVKEGDWFYSAVQFVYRRGYFAGTSGDTFSPKMSMTRGMLATVLHRFSGDGAVELSQDFADVPSKAWYAQGIAWASQTGVMNGVGGGMYQPLGEVTREQMVTMLYRYQKDYRKGALGEPGDVTAFPDGDQVSSWALEPMAWAVGEGLITGRNTGELDPTGTATRAEVATLMERFAKLIESV